MKALPLLALLLVSCGSPSPGTPLDPKIQQQVDKANAIAARQGYAPVAAPTVEILPHDTRCEDPASLAEYTDDLYYDQTDSDKDREVGKVLLCYAGRFIPPNKIRTTQEAIDAGYGVWYEMEHKILWERDPIKYEATKYHPPNHPILGE